MYAYIHIGIFAFLVKKTSGILFFGPSFRKPARKASSGFGNLHAKRRQP